MEMLFYGVLITLPCIMMLLFPRRHVQAVEKRIAAGDDRYFEEQRTYQSYRYLRSAKAIRALGAVGTICGVGFCLMQIFAK
ncbi:hypothetical protein AB5I39_16115 [Sphingomonas sp. MMS24-J45]|uniref:hypothetical protein n=1 Tax=Sphingomonas sp. MMS24-J45 TaxID=3238806 RepID=UPI00384B94C3